MSSVTLVASSRLPTPWGVFSLVGFRENATGKDHAAMVMGDITTQEPVLARIHSECLTGDALLRQRGNQAGAGERGSGLANEFATGVCHDFGFSQYENRINLCRNCQLHPAKYRDGSTAGKPQYFHLTEFISPGAIIQYSLPFPAKR